MSNVLDQCKVLVLNKGWNPVNVVSLRDAMCLVTGGVDGVKARILHHEEKFRDYTWADWSKLKASEGEPVVRSGRGHHKIPEIVLLDSYNKMPFKQKGVKFNRRAIFQRDNNQCQYCGAMPKNKELSIDHIHAKSRGGLTTWTNVCLCCTKCNRRKADKTMQEAGMKFFNPNFKPNKPKFTLVSRNEPKCQSWIDLMGSAYWLVTLENDM